MKKLLAALSLIVLLSTSVFGQTQYCGWDPVDKTLVNHTLYSEELDNAAWTKSTLTVTANDTVAPDGNITAEKLTLTATTSNGRYAYLTTPPNIGNQSARREQVYLKAGTHAYVHVYSQYPSTAFTDVDLTNCTVLRSGSTNTTSYATAQSNGWCLVGFTHTPDNNQVDTTIQPLKDAVTAHTVSWTSTGAETFYVWGAQANIVTDPADYIKAVDTKVTAGLYGSSPKITLSNLILYSEQFDNAAWVNLGTTETANTIVAPNGTTTADTIFETTATATHYIYQLTIPVVSGNTYRFSTYVKKKDKRYMQLTMSAGFATWHANYDLDTGLVSDQSGTVSASMRALAGGWYEIEATATATSTTNTIPILAHIDSATALRLPTYLGDASFGTYAWGFSVNLAVQPEDYLLTTSAAATFGPICPFGTTQSLQDPSRCFPVTAKGVDYTLGGLFN